MKCAYHVATDLVEQRVRRPFLAYSLGYGVAGSVSEKIRRRRADRTILRCPVAGCPFVAQAPNDDSGAPEYSVAAPEAFA